MICVGVIIEVADKTARVAVSPQGPCGHCGEQNRCGLNLFSSRDTCDLSVTAINTIQAKPGDLVEIDLTAREELYVSALVWGLPLTGLVAGAALGAWLSAGSSISENIAALIGCVLGLSIGWAALKLINRSIESKSKFVPQVLRVIKSKASENSLPGS